MKNNKIKKIDDASPLQGKVSAGDCLVSINGNRILDVLDYKFYAYDRHLIWSCRKRMEAVIRCMWRRRKAEISGWILRAT